MQRTTRLQPGRIGRADRVAKMGSDSIFLRDAFAKFHGTENMESDPFFAALRSGMRAWDCQG